MTISLRREIVDLRRWHSSSHRRVDVACQFFSVDRDGAGNLYRSGVESPVYGGTVDLRSLEIVDDHPSSILQLPCSRAQLDLITCDKPRIEGNGGRGGGKSDGGLLRVIRHVAELPGEHGQISGPTYRILRIDWNKLLSVLPASWLLPGSLGIRRLDRELLFSSGGSLRFVSTDNPDALRSWGGSYAFVDEEQDVTDEAIDIIWPSLRLTGDPHMWTAGTPKPGEYYDRHMRVSNDLDARVFRFDSFSNPFVSHRVFELAKSQMDEKTYRQEILAEWIPREEGNEVFYGFDRARHLCDWPVVGKDITREVTASRLGTPFDYIAGLDPNWNFPSYAVIFKVLAPRRTVEKERWYAVDVVKRKGHCGELAEELVRAGYSGRSTVIIPDASARYDRGNGRKSSSRLLREAGFTCRAPQKNPSVTSTIDAVNVLFSPVEGDPRLFVDRDRCAELIEALEEAQWDRSGKDLDRDGAYDHIISAARYAVSYFAPAAKLPRGTQARRAAL